MEFLAAWFIVVIVGINSMISYVAVKNLWISTHQDRVLKRLGLLGLADKKQ